MVPLRNVTEVQALEDNSDTLQWKMLTEAHETLTSWEFYKVASSLCHKHCGYCKTVRSF